MDDKVISLLQQIGDKLDEVLEWKATQGPFIDEIRGHIANKVNKKLDADTFSAFKTKEKDRLDKYRPKISKMLIKTGKLEDPEGFDRLVFDDMIKSAGCDDFDYNNWISKIESEYAPYLDLISEDPEVQAEAEEKIEAVIEEAAAKVDPEASEIVDGIPENEPTVKESAPVEDDDFGWDDEKEEGFGWGSDTKEKKFGWEK